MTTVGTRRNELRFVQHTICRHEPKSAQPNAPSPNHPGWVPLIDKIRDRDQKDRRIQPELHIDDTPPPDWRPPEKPPEARRVIIIDREDDDRDDGPFTIDM